MSSIGLAQRVVLKIVILKLCHSLIINQKLCPKLPKINSTAATCDANIISWKLEAVAHLPGGSHSVNPFHNPYGPHISCSTFIFFCRDDQMAFGDLYLTSKVLPELVCPGFELTQIDHKWQVHIDHNPYKAGCTTVEKWKTAELFIYQQNQSIFMYGCKEHEKGKNVEIGAWILANKYGTNEMKQNVLESGLKVFNQIPEIRKDWWEYSNHSIDCYSELNCSYLADCVTKDDVVELKINDEYEAIDLSYAMIIPVLFSVVIIAIIKIISLQKSRQSRVVPINN